MGLTCDRKNLKRWDSRESRRRPKRKVKKPTHKKKKKKKKKKKEQGGWVAQPRMGKLSNVYAIHTSVAKVRIEK